MLFGPKKELLVKKPRKLRMAERFGHPSALSCRSLRKKLPLFASLLLVCFGERNAGEKESATHELNPQSPIRNPQSPPPYRARTINVTIGRLALAVTL